MMCIISSFQRRSSSASSSNVSLLQAVEGVMSLALCPQLLSQAPQQGFFETKTVRNCCFAHQYIYLILSLDFGGICMRLNIYRGLQMWMSNADTCQTRVNCHSIFIFCSKLIECVTMMACVVCCFKVRSTTKVFIRAKRNPS